MMNQNHSPGIRPLSMHRTTQICQYSFHAMYYQFFQTMQSLLKTHYPNTHTHTHSSKNPLNHTMHNHNINHQHSPPTLQTLITLIPRSKSTVLRSLATAFLLLAVSLSVSIFSSTTSDSLAISFPPVVGLPSGV
jgi:hypothetical protein